ncbi:MAG: RNA polymerase-binding protein DksA [Burkholderiales bacterium]|nr:RNA polymerase-binding protein DksA [Burkholderiales bacterium]
MSKPPAKAPAKAPAKSAGKPAPKAAAKPAAAPAAKKPAAKPAAKPATKPATKPVAKHVTKPVAAPAAKPLAQPAAKAAIKPESKTTPSPAGKSVAKPAAMPSTKPTPAAAPAKPAAAASAPASTRLSGAPSPMTMGSAVALAPVTSHSTFAAPVSNRFTDRFAPPRPTAPEVIEASSTRPPKKIDPKLANAWKTKAGRDLTEDELLAMPDSEYMNEKQLEFFRTRLAQQKDDLLSNAGETTEHLREDTSIVPDPVDRATIEEEHALELRTRDRERKLLKKISQSLARLESGDYGYCDETGEPIGLARLLARPTATLSLEAQQRRELKQKMFGD